MAGDRDPRNPFDGLLAIPATHYMERNPVTGTYRAKITLDSKLGSFLGINAMEGHAFVYDLREDRIGFSESYNCKPKAGPGFMVDDDMFELPTISMDTTSGFPRDPLGPYVDPTGGNDDAVEVAPKTQMPGIPGQMTPGRSNAEGSCVSATCISFVTVGYAMILMTLAVAYQKWKPKDRSKHWDRESANDDEVFDDYGGENEVLNPAFEQHIRHGNVEGFA